MSLNPEHTVTCKKELVAFSPNIASPEEYQLKDKHNKDEETFLIGSMYNSNNT